MKRLRLPRLPRLTANRLAAGIVFGLMLASLDTEHLGVPQFITRRYGLSVPALEFVFGAALPFLLLTDDAPMSKRWRWILFSFGIFPLFLYTLAAVQFVLETPAGRGVLVMYAGALVGLILLKAREVHD